MKIHDVAFILISISSLVWTCSVTYEAQKNLAALTQVQSRRQRHKTDVPAHFSMRDLEAVLCPMHDLIICGFQHLREAGASPDLM